uniref:AlNc14C2G217 protein n=1 Tax=Albugo laibachii Nc14 TaxID=890382 RepID=F0VZN4_9STRA|nr:AlNc14C2G217 [Albugo laibachii Nc14]|eukprot:CCA14106.1 AlNc14C2G217 [Albugo laibachii Nc14]
MLRNFTNDSEVDFYRGASVRQILFAKRSSGFQWSEDVKVEVLEHHLAGIVERYYSLQVEEWWEEEPMLEQAMHRLLHTFATKVNPGPEHETLYSTQKSEEKLD